MSEMTNRTIAVLLIFGIVFSLVATLVSLNRLSNIDRFGITGLVTNTTSGYVNASVTSRVAVNLTLAAVDFGTGYVGMGCNNCTIDTQGESNGAACCANFLTTQKGLVIENTGNTYLQIDVNFSKNASEFIGGTVSVAKFMMLVVQNDSASCHTLGATWSSGYANVPIYNTGESAGLVCNVLSPNAANDSIRLHINITIPDNAPSGDKNASVWVTGTGL